MCNQGLCAKEARNGLHQIDRIDWLDHVSIESGAKGALSIRRSCISRQGDRGQARPSRPHLFKQHVSVLAGETEIRDEQIGAPVGCTLEGLPRRGCGRDPGTGPFQDSRDQLSRIVVIFDDEYTASL